MDSLGRASCTVDFISAPDQPGRKQVYHYIREVETLLSIYILPPLMIEHGFLPRRKNGRKKLIKMIKILFTSQPRGLLIQVCNELMCDAYGF
jgi:hypothetical protein